MMDIMGLMGEVTFSFIILFHFVCVCRSKLMKGLVNHLYEIHWSVCVYWGRKSVRPKIQPIFWWVFNIFVPSVFLSRSHTFGHCFVSSSKHISGPLQPFEHKARSWISMLVDCRTCTIRCLGKSKLWTIQVYLTQHVHEIKCTKKWSTHFCVCASFGCCCYKYTGA